MGIGETLKRLRRERGLTQAEVAKAIHVNRSTYTKYETDVNMPNLEQLKAISAIFDVSSDDILNPKLSISQVTVPAAPIIQKPAVRSDEEKLLGVYNSLDEQSKTQLMSVAYLLMSQSLKAQGIDVQEMVEQQLHKIQNEEGENNDD